MTDQKMSFWDHIGELRRRFIFSLLAILVGTVVAFIYVNDIWYFLIQPLPEKFRHLNYTGLAEPFLTSFKLAFFAGIYATTPFILWQVWMFVAPALYAREKHIAIPFLFTAVMLFVVGTAFCYLVVLPEGNKFLLAFMPDALASPVLTLREYLSFSTVFILVFGFTFELPLFIFVLNRLGVLPVERLKKFRRYWLIVAFILSAILTPGDVVLSQLMLAIPMLLLYEVGIWASIIADKRKKAAAAADGTDEGGTR